jgi:peptidyl-prolyl cis-trans isomerase A (cyclophilin A)
MKKLLISMLSFSMTAGVWAARAQTKPAGAATKKATPAATKATPAAKKTAAAPRRSLLNPASLNEKAPEVYKVKLVTTKGNIVIQVTRAWAPLGADRFYNLVKNGFFTDASFFRVIAGFMAQFGINAKPTINAVWQAATIQDDPVKQSNKRGYVSFATAGANTRTTQLFINYGDNGQLDGQGFSPFGQVVEGMEVVDKLYNEYGEGAPGGNGPDQGRVQAEGKPYLDKNFPKLDSIKIASIMSAATPATKTPVKASPTHKAPAHTTTTPKKNPT